MFNKIFWNNSFEQHLRRTAKNIKRCSTTKNEQKIFWLDFWSKFRQFLAIFRRNLGEKIGKICPKMLVFNVKYFEKYFYFFWKLKEF